MRQAQLGASYRMSYSEGVASLCRAKLNQQPVSSVAPVAEPVYAPVNNTGEAYTEKQSSQNLCGSHALALEHCRPQGKRTSPRRFSPVNEIGTVGDDFNVPEVSTQESLW